MTSVRSGLRSTSQPIAAEHAQADARRAVGELVRERQFLFVHRAEPTARRSSASRSASCDRGSRAISGSLDRRHADHRREHRRHTVKLTDRGPRRPSSKDLDQTYRAIAREVKIPGFRPGKAPKAIIDAQIGQDVVLEEFVSATLPTYFRTAVTDEDLAPIGDPDVDVEQLEPGKAPRLHRHGRGPSAPRVRARPTTRVSRSRARRSRSPTRRSTSGSSVFAEQFAELEPVEPPGGRGRLRHGRRRRRATARVLEALDRAGLPVQRRLRGARRDLRRASSPARRPATSSKFEATLPERVRRGARRRPTADASGSWSRT